MNFTVEGKIVRVFDRQTGVSKSGKSWQKQEYLLETSEPTPQQICFSVFGDQAVENMKATVGEMVVLVFEVISREYQGRWFTNIECRSLEPVTKKKTKKVQLPGTVVNFEPSDESSDLPF